MWPMLKSFLVDSATFGTAMKVAISIVAVAAVDGAFDGIITPNTEWLVNLAYPVVALTAATNRKKKDMK
jgi:hypothetical protein